MKKYNIKNYVRYKNDVIANQPKEKPLSSNIGKNDMFK